VTERYLKLGTVLIGGQMLTVYYCQVCGALILTPELHNRLHKEE